MLQTFFLMVTVGLYDKKLLQPTLVTIVQIITDFVSTRESVSTKKLRLVNPTNLLNRVQ